MRVVQMAAVGSGDGAGLDDRFVHFPMQVVWLTTVGSVEGEGLDQRFGILDASNVDGTWAEMATGCNQAC